MLTSGFENKWQEGFQNQICPRWVRIRKLGFKIRLFEEYLSLADWKHHVVQYFKNTADGWRTSKYASNSSFFPFFSCGHPSWFTSVISELQRSVQLHRSSTSSIRRLSRWSDPVPCSADHSVCSSFYSSSCSCCSSIIKYVQVPVSTPVGHVVPEVKTVVITKVVEKAPAPAPAAPTRTPAPAPAPAAPTRTRAPAPAPVQIVYRDSAESVEIDSRDD